MSSKPPLPASPGLWLPKYLVETPEPSPFFEQCIVVQIGYQYLFDDEPTLEKLVDVVRGYALREVLELLARVSHILQAAERQESPSAQAAIMNLLFSDQGEDLWTRAQERREDNGLVAVFSELQVLTMAKIAMLVCDDTSARARFNARPLGAALMMANDVVLATDDAREPITPEVDVLGDPAWQMEMFRNARFHRRKPDLQELARAAELFHKDRPHLRDCGSYVDLPALQRVLGLPGNAHWAFLLGLSMRFMERSGVELQTTLLAWLATYPGITSAEKPFKRFVAPIADIQALVRATYSVGDLKVYHVLPFAQHPLVALDGMVVCLSRQLLIDGLGVGLYYRLFDARLVSQEERERCKHYMGHVFQDYVEELIGRVFPPSTLARRWFTEKQISACSPKDRKRCDVIVVYEESVVLIEAKASMLSVATIAGDAAAFAKQMDGIIVEAAEQFEGTIKSIREGCFAPLGIPRSVKRIYRLVLSLESLGVHMWSRRYINDQLEKKNLLGGDGTSVLHVMEISELECLEGGLATGERLDHVLDRKVAQPLLENSSFRTAWYIQEEPFLALRNAYLEKVYLERCREVADWLRAAGAED